MDNYEKIIEMLVSRDEEMQMLGRVLLGNVPKHIAPLKKAKLYLYSGTRDHINRARIILSKLPRNVKNMQTVVDLVDYRMSHHSINELGSILKNFLKTKKMLKAIDRDENGYPMVYKEYAKRCMPPLEF